MALAAQVTTRILATDEYPHWSELVGSSPDGSAYSLPGYLAALCDALDGKFRVLVAEHDGHIVGGIALCERKSSFGSLISPRSLLYYNGIVLMPHATKYPSQRSAWQTRTLAALEQALARLTHVRLRFKNRSTLTDLRVFQSSDWSLQPSYTYVVDLSDLPTAWSRVDKNLRRLIGRCTEQGITLTEDDDFDAFYHLHAQTHERKDAPLYLPRAAFKRFIETLRSKGLCRLYHARLPDGRAIATQLVLTGPHPVTHTVCAATDADFLNLGVSAFLRWKVFENLAAKGYQANDLTDAALNPVTHFKSQLGGELHVCLQVSRPDGFLWRLGEFTTSIPGRAKQNILRTIRPTTTKSCP